MMTSKSYSLYGMQIHTMSMKNMKRYSFGVILELLEKVEWVCEKKRDEEAAEEEV